MSGETDTLVAGLRDNPVRLYVACTGAGAGLQALLWSVPGSSSFLVGGAFPYAADAIHDFLGFRPDHFCSPEAALDLAMEAYRRACRDEAAAGSLPSMSAEASPVGLGLTASVASLKEHRGDHRIHLAVITKRSVLARNILLEKGAGAEARLRDGALADTAAVRLIVAALAHDTGAWAASDELSEEPVLVAARARRRFFEHPLFRADGRRGELTDLSHPIFLPGSFNPMHAGHLGAARAVERKTGERVIFSITAKPPHKEPLSLPALLELSKHLRGHDCVFLEGDPLFIDKARRFPGASFVVGADAAKRMLDPKWCPVGPMIEEFGRLGTKFYVLGRLDPAMGVFLTLADLAEAKNLSIFEHVDGRWDISSTEARRAAGENCPR